MVRGGQTFNVHKCNVMHLECKNPLTHYIRAGYPLKKITEEKDLGITVSEDLKWEKQCIAAVVCTANYPLGTIKQNFINR